MKSKDIDEIRDLISKGKDVEAIEKLQGWLSDEEDNNNLLLLLGEYKDLDSSILHGILSTEEIIVQKNRLRLRLIKFADSKIINVPFSTELHNRLKLVRNMMSFGSIKESRSILIKIVWLISFFYSFFNYPVVSGYEFIFKNNYNSENYLWQSISLVPFMSSILFFVYKSFPNSEEISINNRLVYHWKSAF